MPGNAGFRDDCREEQAIIAGRASRPWEGRKSQEPLQPCMQVISLGQAGKQQVVPQVRNYPITLSHGGTEQVISGPEK